MTSFEHNYLTGIEELDSLFAVFAGGTGTVITFVGHRTLTVEFEKDERVFTVRFADCLYMAVPTVWDKVRLSCSRVGDHIQVEHREAEVKIVCRWIHSSENEDEEDEDEDD